MKKLIVLAIIISFFSFISVNGKEIEIALEAELAQKIQAPMIVDDDDVGKGARICASWPNRRTTSNRRGGEFSG